MGAEESEGKGSGRREMEGAGLTLPPSRLKNLRSAADDQQLKDILDNVRSTKSSAVINYGASWCRVCSQILPAFCQLSDSFPKLSFIYADIDEYGERVDEMLGAGEERLRDRLWLHS
ncbi:unnamed protein product [Spirodela intermedia]|uniref:Thioredoxin domain-containing protein n=1 Tax=Spirodela intermedia TaxID=51605 RepID=A0A7I8J9A4_SPIIN|nr:unnamed protein product [Spirodela intermedia]CAA6666561.1 unnamed protein product [Spirodela intermedia]